MNAIISQLKTEAEAVTKRIAAAQQSLARIHAAISALEGAENPAAAEIGLPVSKQIESAARRLAEKHGREVVFDYKQLVITANELFPGRLKMLKRGVYTAAKSLKKDNILKLAPGGLTLA
jgi:hypothetical protein